MAKQLNNNRGLRIQSNTAISSETLITLSANCYAVTLLATTASVALRPNAGETTDIVTIPVGVPIRLQHPSLSGAILYVISATGGIQVIEELNAV